MKKLMLTLAAATLLAPTIPASAAGFSAPQSADRYSVEYGTIAYHDRGRRGHGHGNGNGHGNSRGRHDDRRLSSNERIWQDEQGRYRCRRSDGTVGLIIGAAGGALAGRAIDTRGERTTGTILGGVAGALLGREIDRSRARCR